MANPTNTTPPARRFIKRQDVESITGLSCTEIYRRIAAGTIPSQVTLGPKAVVWIESEVLAWCGEPCSVTRYNLPAGERRCASAVLEVLCSPLNQRQRVAA